MQLSQIILLDFRLFHASQKMARTVDKNELLKEPQSFAVGPYTFTNCQLIGGGTYGTVYKAYDIAQQTHFAIKVIRLDRYGLI